MGLLYRCTGGADNDAKIMELIGDCDWSEEGQGVAYLPAASWSLQGLTFPRTEIADWSEADCTLDHSDARETRHASGK
jgi:hypothetical protein